MFWSESFWLPSNITWKDFENVNTSPYELLYPIPVALLLLVIRDLFIKHTIKIVGPVIGIKCSVRRTSSTNTTLETALKQRKNSNNDIISKKTTQLGLTERKSQRLLRQQKRQDKPTKVEKFAATTWECFFYAGMSVYGLIALWDKPWFRDTRYCWYGYPHHLIEDDAWWYYMIELTWYWSLTFSQIYGNVQKKRKDFWQMLLHHFAAISLICLSWVCNFLRGGMLVFVLHDMADVFLLLGKMCKYANYHKTCNIIFGFFVITWVITRLYLYPVYILYNALIERTEILGMVPVYYIFNVFMIALQILHVMWTYFILRVGIRASKSGKIEKDARSESSSD